MVFYATRNVEGLKAALFSGNPELSQPATVEVRHHWNRKNLLYLAAVNISAYMAILLYKGKL